MITTVLKMVLMLTLRVLFLEDSDVASVKGGVLTIHNLDEDMVKVTIIIITMVIIIFAITHQSTTLTRTWSRRRAAPGRSLSLRWKSRRS